MRKRNSIKNTAAKLEESGNEQMQEEEMSGGNRKGRQDNSLSVLTKKFIELIKGSDNLTIDLNDAVIKLEVQKRRIYDITNVLEGINYVQKLQKNTIKWIGGNEDPEVEKEVLELRQKIDEMIEEEKQLDQEIAQTSRQIKEDFLEDESMRPYHYVTYEDCQNICKTVNKDDPNKTLIIVSAPKGTSLEAGEDEKGSCILRMNATNKGNIKVYTCKATTGVTQLEPSPK